MSYDPPPDDLTQGIEQAPDIMSEEVNEWLIISSLIKELEDHVTRLAGYATFTMAYAATDRPFTANWTAIMVYGTLRLHHTDPRLLVALQGLKDQLEKL